MIGVLLFIITIGGLAAAVLLLGVSLVTGRARLGTLASRGVLIWIVVYAVALLESSVTSKERILARNEAKEFCGFYLDCHLRVAVSDVQTARSIADRKAMGNFYIVTLRVISDARNPSTKMRLLDPQVSVVDGFGNRFPRDVNAEAGLPSGGVDLGNDVTAKTPFEKEIVFDLPESATNPRLDIREGYAIDVAIEAILIGDEDSFLHKRTYLGLEGAR